MISRLSFFSLLCICAFSGCTSSNSISTVRSLGGLEVLSEQREYFSEGGRRNEYREIILKYKGREVDRDFLGGRLFPPGSPCHTPSYRISDVRILKDNALLALFSETQSRCGAGQLAKIEAKEGKLAVLRIPLGKGGAESENIPHAGASTSTRFGYVVDRSVRYGYPGITDELQMQQRSSEQTLFLTTLSGSESSNTAKAAEFEHTFAVDMNEGKADDLGLGNIVALLDDGQIALIRHEILSKPTHAFVEYRAVRLADGGNIDSQRLPFHCFELLGKESIHKEQSYISMLEHGDRLQAQLDATIDNDRKILGLTSASPSNSAEREELAQRRKRENRLNARNNIISTYLQAEHVEVEWKRDRVNIKAGDQLLEKLGCVSHSSVVTSGLTTRPLSFLAKISG